MRALRAPHFYQRALLKLESLRWLPPLLARLAVGFVFAQAGFGKFQNLSRVVEFFEGLGIPAPQLQAPLVATTEFVGGILLILGLCTRAACAPLVITMVVAILTALRSDISELSDLLALSEFQHILLLLWLMIAGPGALSVDGWLARRTAPHEPT